MQSLENYFLFLSKKNFFFQTFRHSVDALTTCESKQHAQPTHNNTRNAAQSNKGRNLHQVESGLTGVRRLWKYRGPRNALRGAQVRSHSNIDRKKSVKTSQNKTRNQDAWRGSSKICRELIGRDTGTIVTTHATDIGVVFGQEEIAPG